MLPQQLSTFVNWSKMWLILNAYTSNRYSDNFKLKACIRQRRIMSAKDAKKTKVIVIDIIRCNEPEIQNKAGHEVISCFNYLGSVVTNSAAKFIKI